MAAYTPVYCSVNDIPKCYQRIIDVQDEINFSWESAYWVEMTPPQGKFPVSALTEAYGYTLPPSGASGASFAQEAARRRVRIERNVNLFIIIRV
jgi:hypothetical protein